MFITNKGVSLPLEITFDGMVVNVVDSFRILGICVDNKLNFMKYCCQIRQAINKKLFSIKRLFFLPSAVKLQFLKTFILPYFDYCSSIYVYFSKAAIQNLSNSYQFCLFKLLGINYNITRLEHFNEFNNLLERKGLQNFQHRIIIRTLVFAHKIISSNNAPTNLVNSLKFKKYIQNQYNIRSINHLITPSIGTMNNFGENTFKYVYSKIINKFLIDEL